jgi:hypothetical protein
MAELFKINFSESQTDPLPDFRVAVAARMMEPVPIVIKF